MKRFLLFLSVVIVTLFTQCETLQTLPTNTSGGLFSLNGSWSLSSNSDNSSMVGTVVQVIPGVSTGTVRSIGNNNYCLRERDAMWRGLNARTGGGFNLELLVGACNGNTTYKPATVTSISNDEIRVTSETTDGKELTQVYRRTAVNE